VVIYVVTAGSCISAEVADIGLLLVFFGQYTSNSHNFRLIRASSCCKNRPKAKIGKSWRHLAYAIRPNRRSTTFHFLFSVKIVLVQLSPFSSFSGFSSRENGPEARIGGRWLPPSGNSQIAVTVFELISLLRIVKTDRQN
jgi:hypothetical protein